MRAPLRCCAARRPSEPRPSRRFGLAAAPTSALELLQAEQRRRHIITFCADLDGLLGGGVAPGEITECALLSLRCACRFHLLTRLPPLCAGSVRAARRCFAAMRVFCTHFDSLRSSTHAQAAAQASAKRSSGAPRASCRMQTLAPLHAARIWPHLTWLCTVALRFRMRSIQLCINVQLPPEFGGLAGEAIYIGACVTACAAQRAGCSIRCLRVLHFPFAPL
jgi:hypothetical protein